MSRTVAASLAAGVLVAACQAAAGARPSYGTVATVPPFTQVATLVGPAPPTQTIHLVVNLAYPKPEAVAAFAQAVNDPASPMYGAFLSPAQFTASFGPSSHSYSTVEYAMTNAGASIATEYANLKTMDVIATVAQADLLFNTTINQYVYNSVVYYANGNPPSVSKSLQGLVMAVSGFTNFAQKVAQPPGSSAVGYGPTDIQRIYKEPIRTHSSLNGSGVTIAVDTAYDYLDSDLLGFWSHYGINRTGTVTRIPILDPVNQGLPNPGPSNETTLDVEQASSSAPGSNLKVFEASDALNSTFDDVYAATVNDPQVDIVTTSFGSCEAAADPYEVAADNDLFAQAAAEGQTWFAADGDLGSHDCGMNDPPFGLPGYPNPDTVDFPSSSPYVTAAGGTSLYLTRRGKFGSETAWSGSGGGVSTFFGLPWYQQGVPSLASQSARNVPDVALNADPNSPYALFYVGSFAFATGGTSAVAPNLAAMQAQFDQNYGKRLGLAQSGLYHAFHRGSYPGNAFHDVTQGSNGDYSAHAGYDNVTGAGSLDATHYMRQIPKMKGSKAL